MSQANDEQTLCKLIEAALFVAGKPLSVEKLCSTVLVDVPVSKKRVQELIELLQQDYKERGIQLVEVNSGYRFQAQQELGFPLSKLWSEKAPKYSRALLETLALIAYRQPITRGEIEQVRGVAVASNIIKSLLERDWIKIVGHKEVPGRPALYATTPAFLDYFSISKIEDLPPLPELVKHTETAH